MINLKDLTTSHLNRIIALKEKIESLEAEITSIVNGGGETPAPVEKVKRRRMSAAARKRIAAGARARWARLKSKTEETPLVSAKKDRRRSPAVRAKLSAAAKARWAKARAAGQNSL